MITLKNINVTFNKGTPLEKRALKNIDLQIDQGEFVTVIGGNGAGKSTLLSVLTGDQVVDSGEIIFDGVEVTTWSPEKRASLVARVFQDPLIGTCASLSVQENLALAYHRGKSRGLRFAVNPKESDFFASHLERLKLGLESRLKDPIGLLSGGQRQAISLIMAVMAPMNILVLDEHTAALDPRTASFILDLTREIVAERKLTTLMVTHSMHQALEVGNRTLMLTDGHIVFDVKGRERSKLEVSDLLRLFKEIVKNEAEEDDILLD